MNRRIDQGGSMASFIIIGVVIVLIAGGLLYWVRQSDSQARKTPEVTVPAPSKSANNKDTKTDESKSQSDTSKAPTGTDSPAQSAPQVSTDSPSPQTNVDQLSHTGPTETLTQLIALGALAAALASFVRSRKSRASL